MTLIGSHTPERLQDQEDCSHANAWSMRDFFSLQERANSAPIEQSQVRGLLSPQAVQEHRGVGRAAAAAAEAVAGLTAATAAAAAAAQLLSPGAPDIPTFHPQPRRLHQPLVTPLLETVASPPLSPDAPRLTAEPRTAFLGMETGSGTPQQQQQQQETKQQSRPQSRPLSRAHSRPHEDLAVVMEIDATTPSPDRDNVNGNMPEWGDSPTPAVGHRSVQNTPEPTQHYHHNIVAAGMVDRMGLPISTPSPGAMPGMTFGQQSYAGVAARFPHHAIGGGGLVASGLPSEFSFASSMLPPPLPAPPHFFHHQHLPLAADAASVGNLSAQAAASGAAFRFPPPLGHNSGPLQQQASKYHLHGQTAASSNAEPTSHVHGQLQHSLQFQVQLQVHLQAQGMQVYQHSALSGLGMSTSWRLPCPVAPAGAAAPRCAPGAPVAEAPLAPVLSTPGGQSAPEMRSAFASVLGTVAEVGAAAPKAMSTSSVPGPELTEGIEEHSSDELACASLPPEINECRGQVAQLSKTQAGSKFLQRQLLKGNEAAVAVILGEVEHDIAQLMCDAYGNYLSSIAFQACTVKQRKPMLQRMAPQVACIACDKRGTHALQALIGLLTTPEEQDLLVSAVKPHIIELCVDPNGTHVVQRLLCCFAPPCTDLVHGLVVASLLQVAHHPHGLCVLKKCISQAKPGSRHQELLLSQLAKHALDLVQSPYGNYAVQHALDEWGGSWCTPIFNSLKGRIMQLSIQKFSSNVVEKLFCAAPPEFRTLFISELVDTEKMSVLVNSNYGHFVVKRALQLAELPQVHLLLDAMRRSIEHMPNRRMRAKWEKVMTTGSDRLGDGGAVSARGACATATSSMGGKSGVRRPA